MDILTHTLSGMAVATCTLTFVPAKWKTKFAVLSVGALGGAFADIDAISLWSHFDATIGALFGLADKGSVIYSSKLWYSHHAFFHSLLASILFGLLLMVILFLGDKRKRSLVDIVRSKYIYPLTFILAYWLHLAGDLPTPASAWGGVALFWPSAEYIGGYGNIWWWNNYDIFLLITLGIAINLIVLSFAKQLKNKTKKIASVIFATMLLLAVYQISTRQFDYAYTQQTSAEYAQMEANSKKEQQRILGKKLYDFMEEFDRKLKFYF